jgi:bifunctional non-homologous end joining protein LigD
VCFAFDLLHLDGFDLRAAPLIECKQLLEGLLTKSPDALRYSEHLVGDGPTILAQACGMGLEGIVSKQRDAPYRSGRTETWSKAKCKVRRAFPIVAFVEKLGASPRKVASLYAGRWDGDRLLYAGKVGTGYTELVARDLRERLDPYIRKGSPLSVAVVKPKATWVEPVLEAEVDFTTETSDGMLRETVFKGLQLTHDAIAAERARQHGHVPANGAPLPAARRGERIPRGEPLAVVVALPRPRALRGSSRHARAAAGAARQPLGRDPRASA